MDSLKMEAWNNLSKTSIHFVFVPIQVFIIVICKWLSEGFLEPFRMFMYKDNLPVIVQLYLHFRVCPLVEVFEVFH